MVGERYLYSAGDKLPESTGDKLPESTGDKLPESTGEDDSTLLGKLFELHWGMAPPGCLVFRQGTILYSDCRGCLLRSICVLCWRMLRSSGDTQLP